MVVVRTDLPVGHHGVRGAVVRSVNGPEMPVSRSRREGTGNRSAQAPMLASFPTGAPIGASRYVPLPLEHTAVEAAFEGHISTVAVDQRFGNPFDTKIEAVYLRCYCSPGGAGPDDVR